MTLKTLADNVAENVPVTIPGVIIGSTDDTASMIRTQAQKAGIALMKYKPWSVLTDEFTITTAAGVEDYALPTDFDRVLDGTLWDRTNFWEMRGGLTPQEWQVIKSGILAQSIGIRRRFRIKKNPVALSNERRIFIDPVPSSIDTLVLEYVRNTWAQSSTGTLQSSWLADDDTGVLDEYLMELGTLWRVLNRLGMAYLEEKGEYQREIAKAWKHERIAPTLSMNRDLSPTFLSPICNVPDTGFGT